MKKTQSTVPQKELTLFDSTCIIVGIIIGAGIYEVTPQVAAGMSSVSGVLAIWLIGGLLALSGALCYAELATTYPREGGDYVYLNRAYGRWAGFLFGWSQMAVIRPGDIALMAFIFGRYAAILYAPFKSSSLFYAAAAVIIFTLINILGVRQGKWTQNVLTVIKALGLLAIVTAAVFAPTHPVKSASTGAFEMTGFQLALILVLFTFGGWNEMAYVAAEVRHPEKNIVHALLLGTLAVTVLYLLVNIAFLHVLGYEQMTQSTAIAVDSVAKTFPQFAARAVAALVCISALGAVNGLIFTGSRISYAMGTEHTVFHRLGQWHPHLGTPVTALTVQGILSLGIVLIAGSFIETILYTAPAVWLFFLATGLSVIVLRRKEGGTPRPYKVSGYPVTVVVFCMAALFMLYSCITFAWKVKPWGLAVLVGMLTAGLILYTVTGHRSLSHRS